MQQFAQHWQTANAAITPDAIKLENGYLLANFNTDITALQTAFTALTAQQAALAGLRNDARNQRKALIRRVEQFRKAVLAAMPASNYAAMLPKAPALDAIDTRFLQPLDTMQTVWTQINATPPAGYVGPLKLEGGYLAATFTTDLAALRTAFAALNTARINTRGLLKTRNALFPLDRQRMKQYRAAIQGRFKKTDPIYLSLPRYSPVSGSTPKPVTNLLFTYDSGENYVRLTFAPSPSANLTQYVLQFSPGPKWNATNVQTLDRRDPMPPYGFGFTLDMIEKGATGLFKVVVVNAHGESTRQPHPRNQTRSPRRNNPPPRKPERPRSRWRHEAPTPLPRLPKTGEGEQKRSTPAPLTVLDAGCRMILPSPSELVTGIRERGRG